MTRLTWADLVLPPINLWSLPSWKAPLILEKKKGEKMKTIELTDEELEAFITIYNDNALWEYVDEFDNETKAFSTLFNKLLLNEVGNE